MKWSTHFLERVSKRWAATSTEVKVGLVSALCVIVAAFIPVLYPYFVDHGRLRVSDIAVKRFSYGLSTMTVLDIKVENLGRAPVRITEATIKVNKIFRFDVPLPPLLRVPASATYNASLAELDEGKSTSVSLFHDIPASSSDRIVIVLGANGLANNVSGQYERNDPSYVAEIRVAFRNGSADLGGFRPVDVLVLSLDSGSASPKPEEEIQALVEKDKLPRMTKGEIKKLMTGWGQVTPKWL